MTKENEDEWNWQDTVKTIIVISVILAFVFLIGRWSKQDKWNGETKSEIQSWCKSFKDGEFQNLNNIPICVSYEKSTDKKYNNLVEVMDTGNCVITGFEGKYRICPITVDTNTTYSFFDPDKITEEKIKGEIKL